MGWFSDECPQCHARVSKKARFCPKCGHGAPKGWVTCPSCRKWVGNDSNFCPHCNHPLHPEERIDIAGGVWDRKLGLFAQRFELSDVTGIMKSGLKIEEGTLAILLDAGKKVAILGPGRHSPEGSLRNINWFGSPPPRSVVMVDAGDCVFRMDFTKMRTAEELPIDVVAEVTLRFDPGNADGFIENLLKDSGVKVLEGRLLAKVEDGSADVALDAKEFEVRGLPTEAVGMWLVSEATAAVKDLCLQSTVEDLVKDPERRPRFEEAIARALRDLLKRSGLELVRVGYVDFISADYEKLRRQYGELDAKRRQLEYDRKMNEYILSEDKARQEFGQARLSASLEDDYAELVIEADVDRKCLDLNERKAREEARRIQDTEEYLAQLAEEKDLAATTRDREVAIAVLAAKGEIDAKEATERLAKLAREHEVEFAELEHKFETARRLRADELDEAKHVSTVNDIGRSEKIKDAQTDETIERRKIDAENYSIKTAQELAQAAAKANLDNLERMAKIDAEERRALADAVRGMSVEELSAVLDDPGKRADLLELAKARIEAEKAKVSSEADVARAKVLAETSQKERLVDEMKAMMADRAAYDEKLVAMLHDIAAKAVEKPVTVVNGAQPAQPTPINIVK
ncbi:MAG: zinc ribbon domain-containing protein [Kiritimatiellae bacterium]|nr:zinc ribbon domain-containing protein [Kiritimatiellia bacterium]